jgi:glycosyltransferase involved in cell wall biosynthesis
MENKISVVLPFFNNESTLSKAIDSVFNQTAKDWELIIVNDGSTDRSELVIYDLLEDQKICYQLQENKGVSSARNLGASLAKCGWLIFLDADDELTPNALKEYLEAIRKNPGKKIFIGGITKVGKEKEYSKLPQDGTYFAKIPGTYCISTSLFHQVGGFDSRLKFSENTELFHRISLLGFPEVIIPEVMIRYYDNPKGGSKNSMNLVESIQIILDKHETTLSNHVKHLFHQILGVNQLRFRCFPEARNHLWKAYILKPHKLTTLSRLVISYFPSIAKKVYAENPR